MKSEIAFEIRRKMCVRVCGHEEGAVKYSGRQIWEIRNVR